MDAQSVPDLIKHFLSSGIPQAGLIGNSYFLYSHGSYYTSWFIFQTKRKKFPTNDVENRNVQGTMSL
jgi:hypothetical protein